MNFVIKGVLTRFSEYLRSREPGDLSKEQLQLRSEYRSLGKTKMKELHKNESVILTSQEFGLKF